MTLAVYMTDDAATLAAHRNNREQWLRSESERLLIEEEIGYRIATVSFPQGRVATGLIPLEPDEQPPEGCFFDPSRNIHVPLSGHRTDGLARALSQLSWERTALPGAHRLPMNLEYLYAGTVVENYGRIRGEIEADGRLWLSFPEELVPALDTADEAQDDIWERSRRSELLSAASVSMNSVAMVQHDRGTWGTGNRATMPTA